MRPDMEKPRARCNWQREINRCDERCWTHNQSLPERVRSVPIVLTLAPQVHASMRRDPKRIPIDQTSRERTKPVHGTLMRGADLRGEPSKLGEVSRAFVHLALPALRVNTEQLVKVSL